MKILFSCNFRHSNADNRAVNYFANSSNADKVKDHRHETRWFHNFHDAFSLRFQGRKMHRECHVSLSLFLSLFLPLALALSFGNAQQWARRYCKKILISRHVTPHAWRVSLSLFFSLSPTEFKLVDRKWFTLAMRQKKILPLALPRRDHKECSFYGKQYLMLFMQQSVVISYHTRFRMEIIIIFTAEVTIRIMIIAASSAIVTFYPLIARTPVIHQKKRSFFISELYEKQTRIHNAYRMLIYHYYYYYSYYHYYCYCCYY